MKTAIVYYSKHHGNTLKLLKAIEAADPNVTLIDALNCGDLSVYDKIGFASGIYYSKFHKSVMSAMEEKLPEGKKVFFLYTYGAKKEGYTLHARTAAIKAKAEILGEYGCYGFNTFGPFKLIGGIAKGRPNQEDIDGAVRFYKETIEK